MRVIAKLSLYLSTRAATITSDTINQYLLSCRAQFVQDRHPFTSAVDQTEYLSGRCPSKDYVEADLSV